METIGNTTIGNTTIPAYFAKSGYYVEGQPGFSFTEALQCWKALCEGELHQFPRRVPLHKSQQEFHDLVCAVWDEIQPLTAAQAFSEKNMERRRVFFRCIGVKALFSSLEPELLDQQVLAFTNHRWDKDNQPYTEKIQDIYELYQIDGGKLFPDMRAQEWQRKRATVYAVRCWCTTTGREYWIYVPAEVAAKRDALEAIAWTVQLGITHPLRIFRQGDVLIAQESAHSEPCKLYHLNRATYTSLLVSQT